jgi:hypothetical protein
VDSGGRVACAVSRACTSAGATQHARFFGSPSADLSCDDRGSRSRSRQHTARTLSRSHTLPLRCPLCCAVLRAVLPCDARAALQVLCCAVKCCD